MPDEGCTKCIIDTPYIEGASAYVVFGTKQLDKAIQMIGTANLTDSEKLAYQQVLQEQCDLKDTMLEALEKWSYVVTDISKAHDVLYKLKDGKK